MREFIRPWKVGTFAVGLFLLIVGSFYFDAPDWDVPISIIMATLAYLTAPWSLRTLLEKKWKQVPLVALATWFTIDGSYWLYWHFKNPRVLQLMRSANWPASLVLYGICGVLWIYRGTVRELWYREHLDSTTNLQLKRPEV